MKNSFSKPVFYCISNLIYNYIVEHKEQATQENAMLLFKNGKTCLEEKELELAKAFFMYAALLGDSRGFKYYYSVR